jgi:hypothetical protein
MKLGTAATSRWRQFPGSRRLRLDIDVAWVAGYCAAGELRGGTADAERGVGWLRLGGTGLPPKLLLAGKSLMTQSKTHPSQSVELGALDQQKYTEIWLFLLL